MAAPVLRAITATPPRGWNLDGHGQPLTSITFSTPETFMASAASKDTSLPPVTGGRAMTAYFMPGRRTSTHLSLEKDAPVSRAIDRAGHILCRPTLGGLHHQYARI